MDDVLTLIHKAFISFTKRAEKSTAEILHDTFVDSAPLFDLLSSKNNQVIYGRRGTGKTHALKYLAQHIQNPSRRPIYVDLRSIGSDGAIYHDASRTVAERSVRLIVDVLRVIGDELYGLAVAKISDAPHPEQITARLDDLEAAIYDVRVVGEEKIEERSVHQTSGESAAKIGVGLASRGFELAAEVSGRNGSSASRETARIVSGQQHLHLDFGRLQAGLRGFLTVLEDPEVWVLIDEWSEIPLDLQPYLADLLRRTLLPVNNIVIKIAAIEHRSRFSIVKSNGEYIGLELGADVSADLNLDDFLVFDNDRRKSIEFFKNLLFRHYRASYEDAAIVSPNDLVRTVFTQAPVFEEFVRAVEGVPRDALNLAAKAATKSFGKPIAMEDVRIAARDWYQQDKAAVVRTEPSLDRTLDYIITTVIGERRARAFLFPSNLRNIVIERLFDARLLHLLKKNVSSRDEPGKRYDVFKIDYGCYVDLINTQKAPSGLFEADEGGFVEVPADDYRSIRRAILRPEDLPKVTD